VAQIYGGLVGLRGMLYHRGWLRRRRLNGPVISVGNLTVGGTGKTPMVLWLAERLIAEGHRPAILTRGYRGKTDAGSHRIAAADEVALLQRSLGEGAFFGVGKDRYHNGRRLEQQGAHWFILDDGFQHLALARDANIVLLDSSNPFGGGLLPAGCLREPRGALARADIVVITRADRAPAIEMIVRRYTAAPLFYARTELEDVVDAPAMAVVLSERNRAQLKFLAFCGVGNPGAFFYDLRRWGFSVVAERKFRDHHRYSLRDLANLEAAATRAGASAMICTEKDVFNLDKLAPVRLPLYACRIHLQPSDADRFWCSVLDSVRRHRPEGCA
jgi:tetraacyldisaccharide 4'-kinase